MFPSLHRLNAPRARPLPPVEDRRTLTERRREYRLGLMRFGWNYCQAEAIAGNAIRACDVPPELRDTNGAQRAKCA